MTVKVYNGDVYDIGQTINGISKFIYINDQWYYYSERLFKPYEYSQSDLIDLIKYDRLSGGEVVTYLGNVFSYINS